MRPKTESSVLHPAHPCPAFFKFRRDCLPTGPKLDMQHMRWNALWPQHTRSLEGSGATAVGGKNTALCSHRRHEISEGAVRSSTLLVRRISAVASLAIGLAMTPTKVLLAMSIGTFGAHLAPPRLPVPAGHLLMDGWGTIGILGQPNSKTPTCENSMIQMIYIYI